MDCPEFLPVFSKSWQRISFSDTTDFILICNNVYVQTHDLLLVTRIIKVRVKNSIRRNEDLCIRSKASCHISERIHCIHRIVGKNRTKAIFHRKIPSIHCRMIAIDAGKFIHHLYLTAFD